MRHNQAQAGKQKRGGRRLARFVSALLAVGLTLSMSTSAFAASGFNGQSVKPSVHADHAVHLANGGQLTQEQNPEKGPWDDVPMYGGTIYIKVGETVTVHLLQRGVALFGTDSLVMPIWSSHNGRDFEATVGINTNVTGMQKSEVLPHLKAYKAENGSDYDTAYCVELYLTGKKAGTEIFYFHDGSGAREGAYYKVVVTGEDSQAQASTTEKKQDEKKTSGDDKKEAAEKKSDSTPAPANTSASGSTYTVQAGDTLAKIALNAYGDMNCWPQLQEANREALAQTKDGLIFVGMILTLPGDIGGGLIPAASAGAGEKLYTVKAGDTYGSIAHAHFGDAGRHKEIFTRNSDRLKDLNTLFEGQVIVLP